MLAAFLFSWVGMVTDPLTHRMGLAILEINALRPFYVWLYNLPLMAWTSFNNTVVLGSLVAALVVFVPLFFAVRWGVTRYRATVGERIRRSALYKSITASKLYNVYRLFRPEA